MRRSALVSIILVGCSGPAACLGDEPNIFPGTAPWVGRGDPAKEMVEGLHRHFDRLTAESVAERPRRWSRDFRSPGDYDRSVDPQREQLRRIIGASPDGERLATKLEVVSQALAGQALAETPRWIARRVRWTVYPDFSAEGVWIEPRGKVLASVVALPDCDVSAEQFAGIVAGLSESAALAELLADRGCRVLIPTLLDRSDDFSGNPAVRLTNLSHREWIYRMAYEVGRHPLGYEVDQVRAAVDWLVAVRPAGTPVGLVGQGEGGIVALHSAALDKRVDATWIGGGFGPRESAWNEPIDRNLWGYLQSFGGAEVASLAAPRSLLIEACLGPEVDGPRPARNGRSDAASGSLTTPKIESVRAEFARLIELTKGLRPTPCRLVAEADGRRPPNSTGRAFSTFADLLKLPKIQDEPPVGPLLVGALANPKERQARIVRGLEAHTRRLLQTSELRRAALWPKAESMTAQAWPAISASFRDRFHDDLIGKAPAPSGPPNPQSVRLFDEPKWTAYAIKLDLWPDVAASGILLWPKDLQPGERRPVVVCQHGLEGTPDPLVDRKLKSVYNAYAAQLADRGYIVYAPQNPYIGVDRFRKLQRKANPLRQSLFSVIVRQHERTLEWLATLPNVDGRRIAFYGLSYGGKTAMRVPAILPGYCLSICSGDFNEWVIKTTNLDRPTSYLYTIEYDMYEFGLAEFANYAEMAALIAPRPFMVERGHLDGVAPDEWVGYEFAKVRRFYDMLGIGDRTEIGYFNQGHEVNGRASFPFLAKHLNWPRGLEKP